MNQNDIDIQYKPKIIYEKDYYSDGLLEEVEKVDQPIIEEPEDEGYLAEERAEIIQKLRRIQQFLEVAPKDIADIVAPPIEFYIADLLDDKWKIPTPIDDEPGSEIPPRIIDRINTPTPDPTPTERIRYEIETEYEDPDLIPDVPEAETLEMDLPDRTPFIVGDIVKKLNATKSIYQEYVDDLYRGLSNFWKESISTAIHAGVSSVKDLQGNFKLGSQEVPDTLRHVADQITISQIKRKQETLFFSKIYNIDKTIAHLRQSSSASDLKERYFEGKDKNKSYKSEADDNWENTKYVTANTSLDVHQNETLANMRDSYEHKYFSSTKNFYKYLMSSCTLTDGILSAYVKESKSKAILKKAGLDIDLWEKDEKALKSKENKSVTERTDKAIDKTVTREEERLKQIEGAIKKSDDEVNKYFNDFPKIGDGTAGGGGSDSSGSSGGDGPGGIPYDGEWDISSSNGKNNGKGGKEYKVDNAPSELGQKILGAAKSFYEEFKGKSSYTANAGLRNGTLYGDCVFLAFEVVRKIIGDDLGRRYSVAQQLNVPGGERIWLSDYKKLKAGDIVYQVDVNKKAGKSGTVSFGGKSVSNNHWHHVYIADGNNGAYEITSWGSIHGLNYESDISTKKLSKGIMAVRRY